MLSHFSTVFRKARALIRHITYTLLFRVCELLLPVNKNYWCFGTWYGHSHTIDNPRAVFESVKNDPSIRKIILQQKGESVPVNEGVNVKFIPAQSIAGAFYLAISKVILIGYTSRAISSFSKYLTTKHTIIQLWHGIPLKKIGKLFPGEEWDAETPKYAATVCSSSRDQVAMAGAFSPLPVERVWITGLPRNDFIVGEEKKLPSDYKIQLESLRKLVGGKKFILYAPTWREVRDTLYVFSDAELSQLNQLLVENDAVLGIRGHSNVRDHASHEGDGLPERIFYVNDYPDANLILRITDVLVTDYSSIYIDYLIKDKPVLHFTYDVDSYVNERGFLYELEDAFASQHFTTFEMLLEKLKNAIQGNDDSSQQRLKSKALFHEHGTESAKQVVDKIKELCH